MAKINLLPPDLGPNASVLKFLNAVKKAATVFSLIFFIFGVLLVGYILFLRIELKSSAQTTEGLKDAISNLKSTEQSLYLLKERTDKIGKLLASEIQESPLGNLSDVLLSETGVKLTQILVSPGKISVSAGSQDITSLGRFFESIISDENYKNIKLMSFSYNPKTGYAFSLDLNLK